MFSYFVVFHFISKFILIFGSTPPSFHNFIAYSLTNLKLDNSSIIMTMYVPGLDFTAQSIIIYGNVE